MGRKLEEGKRITKKTKDKENKQKFGNKSSKHIRINENKLNSKKNPNINSNHISSLKNKN
tara:strand:- start:440 stop:619 length:180 start_codon:yes stop_codon:yes gene_type:complete